MITPAVCSDGRTPHGRVARARQPALTSYRRAALWLALPLRYISPFSQPSWLPERRSCTAAVPRGISWTHRQQCSFDCLLRRLLSADPAHIYLRQYLPASPTRTVRTTSDVIYTESCSSRSWPRAAMWQLLLGDHPVLSHHVVYLVHHTTQSNEAATSRRQLPNVFAQICCTNQISICNDLTRLLP